MKERRSKIIWLGFAAATVVGCGSGSAPQVPNLSEAPATKTILLQPAWPKLLQENVAQFQLQALLKGRDSQGKAAGAVGPVAGAVEEANFKFIFSNVPADLSPSSDLTIDIFWNVAGLPDSCRRVAAILKSAELKDETTTLSVAAQEFDLDQDCDGDGLENIREFLDSLSVNNPDSDGDGTADGADLFPLDALEWADTDGDGIGDNQDNCLEASNVAQADLDEDGLGDFCDPDRDGDGLANTVESDLELNPDASDTDADGVADNEDNCAAVANSAQENADGDLLGDGCDCDAADGRRYQTAEDEPGIDNFDSNCDGIDGTAANALFVSATRGNDNNDGTPSTPYQTLGHAYTEAVSRELDIYVEAGTYTVADLNTTAGVRIYGGYQTETPGEPFGFRCVYPMDCVEVTALTSTEAFLLEQTSGPIFLDGFRIDVPVVVRETEATLENNRMEEGILIDNADSVTLSNNVIRANGGRIAVGLEILGSSPNISNNTIDATNRYDTGGSSTARTAIAIIAENALGLNFQGNLLITGGAENQYGFFCRGLEPAAEGIGDNLFALFPLAEASADTLPRSVSCLGEFDFAAADNLDLGYQEAEGNLDYPAGRTLTDLIDAATYEVMDPDYENFGAGR